MFSIFRVFAQNTEVLHADVEPGLSQSRPFWKRISFGVQAASVSSDVSGNLGEVNLGYDLTDFLELRLGVGKIEAGVSSSGGDLSEWEYCEDQSKLISKYSVIDIRATAWRSPRGYHSFYVSAGAGIMWSQANYEYTRYKPYNGAICLFGGCTKAVEEPASGQNSFTTPITRASIEYEFTFGRGPIINGYRFFAGLSEFHIENEHSDVVGTERRHKPVGTSLYSGASTAINVGSSIQF